MCHYKHSTVYNCPVHPLPLIHRTIRPPVLSIPVLDSLLELPHVLVKHLPPVIIVDASSSPMHQSIEPRPSVLEVGASLLAAAHDGVVFECALEVAAIFDEDVFAESVFEVFFVAANEFGAIGETLLPQSLFFAVFPLAFVVTFVRSIVVLAVAVGLVLGPLPLVETAVVVHHYPQTLLAVPVPVPDIVQSLALVLIQHDPITTPGDGAALAQEVALAVDGGD